MADEIVYSSNLKIEHPTGNFKFPQFGPVNKLLTQTIAGGGTPGEIACVNTGQGTSIDLTLLSASYGGLILLYNPDLTNYVEWGPNSAGNIIVAGEILPGEGYLYRMTRTTPTLRIRANTATVRMQVFGFYK